MQGKALPIGIEDYKRMIDKPYYYIDKTLLIKDLLDAGGAVNLFTRPRRFGKTLALSMIKTFFECETDLQGKIADNRKYFDGMQIQKAGGAYMSHMGKYAVISLSLKSAKQPTYGLACAQIREAVSLEFKRHRYVLLGDALLKSEKERFLAVMEQRADDAVFVTALKFLSECLRAYHKKNVVILIDEYDVPLENAYFRGFYMPVADLIRSLFESVLKTNECMEFAVITGCLRITRESIFTGLNNLTVNSVLSRNYAEYFGFTETETRRMLKDYGLECKMGEVGRWYDGYLFGDTEVYNPWSIVNYVKDVSSHIHALPKPYWSNVSSNSIVRELVEKSDGNAQKTVIEGLLAGNSIEIAVQEDVTYENIYASQDNLWSFLFFTGYLKKTAEYLKNEQIYLTLRIPNLEVASVYRRTIMEWFEQKIKAADFSGFYRSLLQGDAQSVEETLKRQLAGSISYYDNAEAFYHGFLMGLLGALPGYDIQSNREYGGGRPDIVLLPFDEQRPAVILELKRADLFTQMEKKCMDALEQIDERGYDDGLLFEGYQHILHYGICFCKKSCRAICRKRKENKK